jgi:hypothetical protein
MSTVSTRDRRAILVGALVVVPALAFIWGVRPYMAALDTARDRLDAERTTLASEQGALAAARRNPELRQVVDSALQAMQPKLFRGHDDVIASAELASYLGQVARRSHVWLQDAATRTATTTTPGVRTLHVDVRAQTDFRGLLTFLDALDHGDKLVRVERMDVSRGVAGPGDENVEVLTITATLAGYALGDEEAPPSAAVRAANPGSRP